MLTQLSTVKARLGLSDSAADDILTNAIASVSAQFDRFCNRTFARTASAKDEFEANKTQIPISIYPLEVVAWFELKTTETEGWIQVSPSPDYLVRGNCVVSLLRRLGSSRQQARVLYTGGYILPGADASAGQFPLPADIEQACVEQVAYWYQTRTKITPPSGTEPLGSVGQIAQVGLLPSVQAALSPYRRWSA